MQIGIVGLPNVGKSTLFNALSKNSHAEAANYPFCTIDPNVGIIEVPDSRIEQIAELVKPEKVISAVTEFVDIAGLVKGASEGEGLGNKFLANIRECDAIAQVIRVFSDPNVTHVHESVDPLRDKEIIETELILADLQTVEKRLGSIIKESRVKPKESEQKLQLFQKIKSLLSSGEKISLSDYDDEEQAMIKEACLLSSKPFLYIANVSEDMVNNFNTSEWKTKLNLKESDQILPICASLESELMQMSPEDAQLFLDDLGIQDTGRTQLIKAAYKILGLSTYFTAGVQEVRAWTFKQGMKADKCAGIIHTDFEKGFICADVVSTEDFLSSGGWSLARESGKVKMQGRDYQMQDGDICLFKFNN